MEQSTLTSTTKPTNEIPYDKFPYDKVFAAVEEMVALEDEPATRYLLQKMQQDWRVLESAMVEPSYYIPQLKESTKRLVQNADCLRKELEQITTAVSVQTHEVRSLVGCWVMKAVAALWQYPKLPLDTALVRELIERTAAFQEFVLWIRDYLKHTKRNTYDRQAIQEQLELKYIPQLTDFVNIVLPVIWEREKEDDKQ